jgi:hypothetical protein
MARPLRLGLAALAAAAAGLAAWALVAPEPGVEGFVRTEREVIYNVYAAGVLDLDRDGRADRYTVNHSALQWVRLAGAREGNAALDLGFAQDPSLPGLEAAADPVPRLRPARILIDENTFTVEVGADAAAPLRGRFTVPWKTEARAEGPAAVETAACDGAPGCTEIAFEVRPGGRALILPVPPPSDGFPVGIALDPGTDLGTVQVGRLALPPPGHAFGFRTRDRHDVAATDLDGDGVPELFVSRGGARGLLAGADPEGQDELFVWTGTRWEDRIGGTGIEKAACPGRDAAWFDATGDGRADLYQVCGRADGDNAAMANRLYVQQPDGRFHEAAARYGLALEGTGTIAVVAGDDGRPPALAWSGPAGLALLAPGADGVYRTAWTVAREAREGDRLVLPGDLDGDGAPDLLLASKYGNLVAGLGREAGIETAVVTPPGALGLPEASTAAAAADIDGDGDTDLYLHPQGIYRQDGGGFTALGAPAGGTPGDALAVWHDTDGDGDPDLWLIRRNGAHAARPVRALYRRLPDGWLKARMLGWYGPAALHERYWLSELYENRLGGS